MAWQFAPPARVGFQVHFVEREPDMMAIERLLSALAQACGLPEPSPTWWVNFRAIDEGSWGSGGGALSVLSLLELPARRAAPA